MAVEDWDNDLDFDGDFQGFANSTGAASVAPSSRMSMKSESLAGDDDWNISLQPDEPQSTDNAIQSAKQAGIPLPANIPQSALLGGTIKRLGKAKSRQKLKDDFDDDFDMPEGDTDGGLTLKPRLQERAKSPFGGFGGFGGFGDDDEGGFDDLEGSLGIRFAGTKRDNRGRSSDASAMSPSMGSVTAESEVDDLGGLDIPEGPMDFDAILKKRNARDAELSEASQHSGQSPNPMAIEQPTTNNNHKKSKLLADDNEDFLNDFDFGGGEMLDTRKRTINKNLKVTNNSKATPPTSRPATTLNFHDKPTEKPTHVRSHIPRPVTSSKPTSRLEPVFESGATPGQNNNRRQPTTTHSQLLRSKRSMPALRSGGGGAQTTQPGNRPPPTFMQPTASSRQPPSAHAGAQRAVPYHLRRDSDPNNRGGAQSPPARSYSRLSNTFNPDTPSRRRDNRPDMAPAALAREAASKRNVTKPTRRRNYGDGNELEVFDDLPTSTTKEAKYMKEPIARGPPKLGNRNPPPSAPSAPSTLRQKPSQRNLNTQTASAIPDRMAMETPAPQTPRSPTKGFAEAQNNTPSYLRDTAASRIARETRLSRQERPRSEGPLQPLSTNWKAQIAARSPVNSPQAQRKGKKVAPQLIKPLGGDIRKTEKGMTYNPTTKRWEGNENTLNLRGFDSYDATLVPPLPTPTPQSSNPSHLHHRDRDYLSRPKSLNLPAPSQPHHQTSSIPAPAPSPPRPALIAPMNPSTGGQNIQVNGGMVFDPRQMKWLKLNSKTGRDVSGGGHALQRGPLSPSLTENDDEDEDPFAGLEDLKVEEETAGAAGGGFGGSMHAGGGGGGLGSPLSLPVDGSGGVGNAGNAGGGEMHEEFDLGPAFITRQREEEAAWRKRCAGWFPEEGIKRVEDGGWRWAVRGLVAEGDGNGVSGLDGLVV
ncbi:hypothetical protein MBLNU230_g7080t1 [Neophaeotheca triangularis]